MTQPIQIKTSVPTLHPHCLRGDARAVGLRSNADELRSDRGKLGIVEIAGSFQLHQPLQARRQIAINGHA